MWCTYSCIDVKKTTTGVHQQSEIERTKWLGIRKPKIKTSELSPHT
jgi:hypothetical protein